MRAQFAVLFASISLSASCVSTTASELPTGILLARARDHYEPPVTERGLEVVAFVTAQIGRHYCWGGSGPQCFDCTGLVEAAWGRAGVYVPRTSGDIAKSLPEVPVDQ